jgi:hypothetical protein
MAPPDGGAGLPGGGSGAGGGAGQAPVGSASGPSGGSSPSNLSTSLSDLATVAAADPQFWPSFSFSFGGEPQGSLPIPLLGGILGGLFGSGGGGQDLPQDYDHKTRYGRHWIFPVLGISGQNTPPMKPSAKASPSNQRPLGKLQSFLDKLWQFWTKQQPECQGIWVPLKSEDVGAPLGDARTGSAFGCLCCWGCMACDGSLDLYNKLEDRPRTHELLLGSGKCGCSQPGPETGCPQSK